MGIVQNSESRAGTRRRLCPPVSPRASFQKADPSAPSFSHRRWPGAPSLLAPSSSASPSVSGTFPRQRMRTAFVYGAETGNASSRCAGLVTDRATPRPCPRRSPGPGCDSRSLGAHALRPHASVSVCPVDSWQWSCRARGCVRTRCDLYRHAGGSARWIPARGIVGSKSMCVRDCTWARAGGR